MAERKTDTASEQASSEVRKIVLRIYAEEMLPAGNGSELDHLLAILNDSIPGFLGDLIRVLNAENLVETVVSQESREDGETASSEFSVDAEEDEAQSQAAASPPGQGAEPIVGKPVEDDRGGASPSPPVATVPTPTAPVRGRQPFNEVSRLPKPRISASNDTDIRAAIAATLTRSWRATPPELQRAYLVGECAHTLARLEESLSTEEFVEFVVTLTAKWDLPSGVFPLLRHLRRILDNVPDGDRGDAWDETLLLLARHAWAAQVVKATGIQPETWVTLTYLHELLVRAAAVAVPINTVADAAQTMLEVLHHIGRMRGTPGGGDVRCALALLSIARNVPKMLPTTFDLAVLPVGWADVLMACGQGQVLEEFGLSRAAQLWLWSAAILTLADQRKYEQMVRSAVSFCLTDTGGARELKLLLAAYGVSQAVKHCGGIGTPLARNSVGALFTVLKSMSETGPVNDVVLENAARLYGQIIAGFGRDMTGAESWRRRQRPAVQAVWRTEVPSIPKGNDSDSLPSDSIVYSQLMLKSDGEILTPQVLGAALDKWMGADFEHYASEDLKPFFQNLIDAPAVTSELVQGWYGAALKGGPLVGSGWVEAKNWSGLERSCKLEQPGPDTRYSIVAAFRQLYSKG